MADIFVSFTSSDRNWAFWIGQELEKLGHVPHIHEWEISAGGDIPKWMEESLERADHCLLVIGKIYLTKPYSSWERRAAQSAAASKRPNFAEPPILLAYFKRCALHGLSEEEARATLAEFLRPAQRPTGPQPFPGGARTTPSVAASAAPIVFPGSAYALANIPIAIPFHFLGRDDALAAIETALKRDEGRVAVTALHGLRGVGKTTLAAAYAGAHRGDYRASCAVGERARHEIQKTPCRRTVNSAERTLTAVMAVPHPGFWEKSAASIGSNGSTSSGDFS